MNQKYAKKFNNYEKKEEHDCPSSHLVNVDILCNLKSHVITVDR